MTSILVVDDRQADRELLSTVLGYAGYEVVEASDGEQAFELARSVDPALVVTDMLMPRMNGYELVRKLRDEPRTAKTPIVLCTAVYREEELKRLVDAFGVSRLMRKPVDPREVVRIVGEIVGTGRELPDPVPVADFDREQLRVLNDKLVEAVDELERVSAERQQLIVALLDAHEEERGRIANDLHDDAIQAVTAVALRLEMLGRELSDAKQREGIERLHESTTGALERLRKLLFELQPASLHTQGIAVALRVFLEDLERTQSLGFELDTDGWREPHEPTRTLLYRCAQEALANVRKHAGASRVEVGLSTHDGVFSIRVADDGGGFDPEEGLRVRPGHLGLPSMRDRVRMAGGSLHIASKPGEGSAVEISLPELEHATT